MVHQLIDQRLQQVPYEGQEVHFGAAELAGNGVCAAAIGWGQGNVCLDVVLPACE
jgi:hypothetical protein